ncbi:MAG: GtrA family protein [Planctomycetota bacterium]|jgi:putative flippase GtrA
MLDRLINRLWRFRLLRFAGGGALNLCNRLLLAFLFAALHMPVWLNYALVHAVTLVFAFFYHSHATFRKRPTLLGFRRFVLSVLALRVADYLFVVLANQIGAMQHQVSAVPHIGDFLGRYFFYATIIVSSVCMFFIRYTIFRKWTFDQPLNTSMRRTTTEPATFSAGGR